MHARHHLIYIYILLDSGENPRRLPAQDPARSDAAPETPAGLSPRPRSAPAEAVGFWAETAIRWFARKFSGSWLRAKNTCMHACCTQAASGSEDSSPTSPADEAICAAPRVFLPYNLGAFDRDRARCRRSCARRCGDWKRCSSGRLAECLGYRSTVSAGNPIRRRKGVPRKLDLPQGLLSRVFVVYNSISLLTLARRRTSTSAPPPRVRGELEVETEGVSEQAAAAALPAEKTPAEKRGLLPPPPAVRSTQRVPINPPPPPRR
jgi:hypothetical protein